MNGNDRILDISWGTIVKLVLAGFLVYVIFFGSGYSGPRAFWGDHIDPL